MATKKTAAAAEQAANENVQGAADAVAAAQATGTHADIIREALMKTNRERIVDLLDLMQEIGFLDAPCSGGNHLAKKGGLAEHSVNVLDRKSVV